MRTGLRSVTACVLLSTVVACGSREDPPVEYQSVPDLCDKLELAPYEELEPEWRLDAFDGAGHDSERDEDDVFCSYTDVTSLDRLDFGLDVHLFIQTSPAPAPDRYEQLIADQLADADLRDQEGPWDEAVSYVVGDGEIVRSLEVGWLIRHGNAVVRVKYDQQEPRFGLLSRLTGGETLPWEPEHPPEKLHPILHDTALEAMDASRVTG